MTVMNKDEAAKLNEIFRRKSSAALNSLIQTPPRPSLVARTGGQSVKPPFSRVRFSDNDNVRVLSAEPEIVTDGSRDLEIDETEDKTEIRKRKQREKRRRRGVLLSEPET